MGHSRQTFSMILRLIRFGRVFEWEINFCYIKCLGILGARDAVMSNRNIEKLAEAQEVVELPFRVRE